MWPWPASTPGPPGRLSPARSTGTRSPPSPAWARAWPRSATATSRQGARCSSSPWPSTPSDPLLRSYLGKAYFEEGSYRIASDELATAKELDPNDPTPWLYDAITKQLTNRPIEGLRDLEKATELNDNRAVYRSRLLLDQDRGTRSVGLGRVYQDLGFEQLGINEASRSLLLDNANAGAHRFLADLYSQQPRSELAYFSERLQTLLLQPPSRTPVSPRLALSDLSEIARPGFGAGSFNEFSSLFDRNGIAFNGNGRVGSNETRNGEAIVSALADNVALSAGVLKSENDGFRDNDELRLEVADVFGQVALSPELSLQAEYRARELDRGSLAFDLDPDRRDETEKANVNQEAARVGLHYAPAPGHDLLVSAAYGDRNTEDSFEIPFIVPIEIETPTDEQGRQLEVQHRWQMPDLGIIAGVGDYDFDLEQSDVPDDYHAALRLCQDQPPTAAEPDRDPGRRHRRLPRHPARHRQDRDRPAGGAGVPTSGRPNAACGLLGAAQAASGGKRVRSCRPRSPA